MDPSRTTYRRQWHSSSPYVLPVCSPPSVYGTPGRMYSSPASTMSSVPIGVSYSSRSLASSVRDVPPSPPSTKRRLYNDVPKPRFSSGYSPGLSSYQRTSTTLSHDPYDVSSSNSVSCSQSSKLTRRIDKFLKSSEQSLDHAARRSTTSRAGPLASPEVSLSLSGRAFRSTSAASIAVKADRHLESLKDGKKAAAGGGGRGCSTSDSLDDLDSDSDEGLNDISDDTSADLSKLDDLSSDSDDEFFDVIPILKPTELPKPANTCVAPTSHTPSRSQSGPALTRVAPSAVPSMVLGATSKPAPGTAAPAPPPKDAKPVVAPALERPVTPSLQHKKGPAPQPPGTLSRQASSASIVRPKEAVTNPSQEPLARQASNVSLIRQASSASLARHSLAVSEDGTVPSTPMAGKRCQRAPSFKKYAAPQPPGVSRQNSMISINSLATADKPSLPAAFGTTPCSLTETASTANMMIDKPRVDTKQTNGLALDQKTQSSSAAVTCTSPPHDPLARQTSSASLIQQTSSASLTIHSLAVSKDGTAPSTPMAASTLVPNGMVNGAKESSCDSAECATIVASPGPPASQTKTINGHVDDILTAFKKGASDSLHQLKNSTAESTESKLKKSNVCNGVPISTEDGDRVAGRQSASRDVSVDSSYADDDCSRNSASRDGGSTKAANRKLSAITRKFEVDSSKTEQKCAKKIPPDSKGTKFSAKVPKNKLGNLASKFEVGDAKSEFVRDSRSPSVGLSKLQSPYSKPFDPEPTVPPVTQRKSIGGINVSKFGGTGKFPTQSQLRKNSKTEISESTKQTSVKDEISSAACKDEDSVAKSAEPIEITLSTSTDRSKDNKERPNEDETPCANSADGSAPSSKAALSSKHSSSLDVETTLPTDVGSISSTAPTVRSEISSSAPTSLAQISSTAPADVATVNSVAPTDMGKISSSSPPGVATGSCNVRTDDAPSSISSPTDMVTSSCIAPTDVVKISSTAHTNVVTGSSFASPDVAQGISIARTCVATGSSSIASTDVATGSSIALTDVTKVGISATIDVALCSSIASTSVATGSSGAPNQSRVVCSTPTVGATAAIPEPSLSAASLPSYVASSNALKKNLRSSSSNCAILDSSSSSSLFTGEQSAIEHGSLSMPPESPPTSPTVSPPSSAFDVCASPLATHVAQAVLPCVIASAASEAGSIQFTPTPAPTTVSLSLPSITTETASVSLPADVSSPAISIEPVSTSFSSILGITPLASSATAAISSTAPGASHAGTSPDPKADPERTAVLGPIFSLSSRAKSENEFEISSAYSTPLDVTCPDFTRASDGLNLAILTPSLSIPSASIYTRASSVSPSISTGITGSPVSGLNLPYGDDPFSRARSLTPLERRGERSVRPKSRFLRSEARGSEMTFSSIELDKPESALEKYRRRREMRNSAAKSKLDALTNQDREMSFSDTSLNNNNMIVDIPTTSSFEASIKEGMRFKIDLSSIKDFLRKTEEEISKLPRYIREPWTMSEMLSSRAPELSATDGKETVEGAVGGVSGGASPSVDGLDSSSGKSSLQSLDYLRHSPRSSDGDDEVYVDARDAIDTSQMDTLMPLPDTRDLERRCRSITPSRVLANTEKLLSQTDRILKKSRSGNSLRKSYSRSLSAANIERLAEVVADLAEEHSTAQLAGERLEAEQADRMRLEKELDNAQNDMRELSAATERLESKKSALRTEMLQHATSLNNGDLTEPDDASAASLYKRKFEWSQREVESLKQQMRQHQQDEHEQTGLLKKQLEKKVGDAREEAEEQRQVAAQLKKRTQRLQAEMNDLKILLEEQTARNILLEKKQRKFDSELAAGQDELRVERLNKEKVVRERDAHLAEKYAVDQEVATLKLELELRDERVAALSKQLEELSFAGQGDVEITQLRKGKHVLESKIKDQEEELDDLAGQVQVLEAARTRLEMSLEQLRKETRLEAQQRDEELEEVRCAAQKKVKALEAQVETEHEERTQLVREKHELERRMLELMDRSSVAPDDDAVHRLKKDLRKTKALLKDTQTMLEKTQCEGPNKLIIRQLKTQLEDCEFAKTAALKARQSADADLNEMQSSLDDAQRARKEAEDRYSRLLKEKTELQTQLEEGEELHAETLKKYKSTVSQISVDQITLAEQSQRVAELEQERQVLSDRLQELSSKVEVLEGETANIHTQRMLQMKVKELESKLELELATRKRIESQLTRLKEHLERLSGECDLAKLKETQSGDQVKKMSRHLRQSKEEAAVLQQRNTELSSKKQEQEKQMELMDSEIATLKSDLKLAFKRIEDLQMALQGDISDSDSDLSDRGEDSMSPGSDAMAIIEEAKEEMQHSESFA